MSRSKKLLIAGLVLLLGFGLAWPFRKSSGERDRESVVKRQMRDVQRVQQSVQKMSTPQAGTRPPQLGSPAPHVMAKMTKMSDGGVFRQRRAPTASFDLANHPALATPLAPRLTSPVTPSMPSKIQTKIRTTQPKQIPFQVQPDRVQKHQIDPRLVYSTIDRDHQSSSDEQQDAEVRHVVQNSDTLEKLAKRYLGDESRALEIFDLNRDILDNPHLLPIAAELQIPAHRFVD